jgi:hypothetical protein
MPLLTIGLRWLRWFSIAAVFSYGLSYFELSFRPFWVHFITGAALWFFVETTYNLLAIRVLSTSDHSLFPNFRDNKQGSVYPADKKFIRTREWLSKHGFHKLSALTAEIVEGYELKTFTYQSEDCCTRIQIYYIPSARSGIKEYFSITSRDDNGRIWLSENLTHPFGGYYPNKWIVNRSPLTASINNLLKKHTSSLSQSNAILVPFASTVLEEVNAMQSELKEFNQKIGFLTPQNELKISQEGRYRIWKEMWLLAYLGCTVQYKLAR